MKRFAKIAALSLAISTAAAAQPYPENAPFEHHDRGYDRGPYDYGHYDRYRRHNQQDWFTLAEAYTANGSRQEIPLAPTGRLQFLRVEATRGIPYIHRIVLVYGDGSRRSFWIQRPLNHKLHEGFDLRIGGREVRQVLVVAEPDPQAAYVILGAG